MLIPPELLRDSFEETTVILETNNFDEATDGIDDAIIGTDGIVLETDENDIISVTSQVFITTEIDLTQNLENQTPTLLDSCKIGNNSFPLGTTIRNCSY